MQWPPKAGSLGGKVDQPRLEQMLNEMGRQGWELVNVFDTNQTNGATRNIVGVLKRAANAT